MQTIDMTGDVRLEVGKGPARQLRMRGRIPAVIYSAGNSTPLSLDTREITRMIQTTSSRNTLITLRLKEGDRIAILRDVRRDPITGTVLHADLFEVAMDRPIDIRVPVTVTGTAVGVKAGGILQLTLREIQLRAIPSQIPDRITVDVSGLNVNQAIHVRDLPVPEGVTFMSHGGQSVVSIALAISEEKLQAMLTTAPKEGAGPEVLTAKAEAEGAAGTPAAKGDAKGADAKAKAKPEAKKEGKK